MHQAVGDFRDWLLSDAATPALLESIRAGVTPEMAAAVSKLMRNQDLIQVARKCQVTARCRNTLGLPGRMSVRLQPIHPTDDARGIAVAMLDGLFHGAGDAVIGINPVSDSLPAVLDLLKTLDAVISRFRIPTQFCVPTHVTSQISAIEQGVDQQTCKARADAVARRYSPLLMNTVVGFIAPEHL